MKLQEAIISVLSGDSILFLGSGASVGAINYNDVELVTGARLANRIYNGCDDLQQAVDFFIDDKESDGLDGKKELITFLEDEFNVKQITEAQKLIPSVPWKRIYTTNYDNVVEKAYDKENKKIYSATISSNAASLLSKKDLIYLHINGYINNLSKEKLNSEFKLSDESYNNDTFTKSKWGELFRMDLKNFSSIIFIGFSLRYDLDIKRILSKYINNFSKEKIFFIVAKDEPDNNVRYLKKYGCVESIGMDGFFNQVNSIQKSFIPLDETIISKIVLFMVTLKAMTLDLDYEDVLNLLETGIVDYSFEKNTDVCEIIDFDGKKTSIKSVILCIWMIKHCNPDDIIDILIQAARTADIASSINKKYLNFLGNIISYKHLKFIFN